MIVGIRGTLEKKEPTLLHVNAGGLIYGVAVSLNTSSQIVEKEIHLHTTHIIREDAQLLFGFFDLDEKMMFDELIKISGVGPKAAMAICSTFSPSTFEQIVKSGDISALKRVVGIGPKSAGRILVELSGFVLSDSSPSSTNMHHSEAVMALESLGFKKDMINKALQGITANDTSELVKAALKKLQKL